MYIYECILLRNEFLLCSRHVILYKYICVYVFSDMNSAIDKFNTGEKNIMIRKKYYMGRKTSASCQKLFCNIYCKCMLR